MLSVVPTTEATREAEAAPASYVATTVLAAPSRAREDTIRADTADTRTDGADDGAASKL
jgi:hypothetical protein